MIHGDSSARARRVRGRPAGAVAVCFIAACLVDLCFVGLCFVGCGDEPDDGDGGPTGEWTDVSETRPDAPPISPFDECVVTTKRMAAASAAHVPECSVLTYASEPPVAGPHYGVWARFGEHAAPVPWGYLLHSLEHGAVVIAYRCDDGCDALVTSLREIVDARGEDPRCRSQNARNRMILVPDPGLEAAIVAVSWEHAYLATCFDRASLAAFVEAHYGMAPEALCAEGVDRASTGWCGAAVPR